MRSLILKVMPRSNICKLSFWLLLPPFLAFGTLIFVGYVDARITLPEGIATVYDQHYFDRQTARSYAGATKYVRLLRHIFKPKSVVDLGCGRGAWLKAFREAGARDLVGFDGQWLSQKQMLDSSIRFHQTDLNFPLFFNQRFDLAISTELGEHLKPASARILVQSLIKLADVVLFSAAYTGQGGVGHINEQPHSYWAKMFVADGYVPFDIFRSQIWGDPEVPYYYQQNVFLYVRKGSESYQALLKKQVFPLQNIEFMNCLHPKIIENYRAPKLIKLGLLKRKIQQALPGLVSFVKRIHL